MGDIAFSTDDPVFLKGSQKETTNPITYQKDAVPSHKICHKNFVETDIRGFGTKVGTYSNYSTIIEAMLPMFQRPEQSRQREELLMRKQLLREINGQEIDRIKGVDAKGPPKDDWLKFQQIDPDDDDATKAEKYYHNSLVICKKPYFFRYLYPELNQKFKQYENAYNEKCRALFGTKLKKLLSKENKTDAEKTLVKRYHKFLPLINTNCIMNILCREIEDVDFDINFAKDCTSMLPHYDLDTFEFDPTILQKLKILYSRWNNKKSVNYIDSLYDDLNNDDVTEMRFIIMDAEKESIKSEYDSLNLTPMEGLTYFAKLATNYKKYNYASVWDIMGEDILTCIDEQDALAPVEDVTGQEYLGRFFKLKSIPKEAKKYVVNEETGEVTFINEEETTNEQ